MSVDTPEHTCACGYTFDMATYAGAGDLMPKPGDVTLCLRCARPYLFGPGMSVTPLDLANLDADNRRNVEKMQRHVREFHRRRPS